MRLVALVNHMEQGLFHTLHIICRMLAELRFGSVAIISLAPSRIIFNRYNLSFRVNINQKCAHGIGPEVKSDYIIRNGSRTIFTLFHFRLFRFGYFT